MKVYKFNKINKYMNKFLGTMFSFLMEWYMDPNVQHISLPRFFPISLDCLPHFDSCYYYYYYYYFIIFIGNLGYIFPAWN